MPHLTEESLAILEEDLEAMEACRSDDDGEESPVPRWRFLLDKEKVLVAEETRRSVENAIPAPEIK